MVGGAGWNPWRELRARRHLVLMWAPLDGLRGRIDDVPGGRQITLDPTLSRIERNAVLAHELVHDERGLLPCGTPQRWRDREERAVRGEVARRLVPLDLLQDWATARVIDFGRCEVHEVAAEFEVPLDVAEDAMRLLAQGRHPTAGAA